jgi:hypothetical protein
MVHAGTWGYIQAAHEILKQTAGQDFKHLAVVGEQTRMEIQVADLHLARNCQSNFHLTCCRHAAAVAQLPG